MDSISTKFGHFTFTMFLLSALCGTLYFAKGFLKIKAYSSLRVKHRYEPLFHFFKDDSLIDEYIETHKNRSNMYKQVVWNIIDGLPIYVLESRPNSSIVQF